MAEVKTRQFKSASVRAIRDPNIQRALGAPFAHFVDGRASAIEADYTEESWESMRDRAAAIKAHTIERLDYYLDLVDRSVRRNGGHVHFADDAEHANRLTAYHQSRAHLNVLNPLGDKLFRQGQAHPLVEQLG